MKCENWHSDPPGGIEKHEKVFVLSIWLWHTVSPFMIKFSSFCVKLSVTFWDIPYPFTSFRTFCFFLNISGKLYRMALCCLSTSTSPNRRGNILQKNKEENLLQESPKTTRTANTTLKLSRESIHEESDSV